MSRGASHGAPRPARRLQLHFTLAAVRLTLGLAGAAASTLLGASVASATVAAAVGAAVTLFALVAPGGRQRPSQFPRLPAPGPQPFWRAVAVALYPSTYGVAALTAIALAADAVLAAVLAGVLLGLGLATLSYVVPESLAALSGRRG